MQRADALALLLDLLRSRQPPLISVLWAVQSHPLGQKLSGADWWQIRAAALPAAGEAGEGGSVGPRAEGAGDDGEARLGLVAE